MLVAVAEVRRGSPAATAALTPSHAPSPFRQVPLLMLAETLGESMMANPLQPHNVAGVNGTIVERYPRSTARLMADTWGDVDFESAAGDVVAMQMPYVLWRRLILALVLNVGFYLCSFALYGWDRVKGNVRAVAIVFLVLTTATSLFRDYLAIRNDLSLDGILAATYMVLVGISAMYVFMVPSEHGWQKTLGPVLVSWMGDKGCNGTTDPILSLTHLLFASHSS